MYRILVCIFGFLLFKQCGSDEHTYGTMKGLDFYENEILNTIQKVPKNYTIVFKYIGSAHSPFIDYCKIDVTATSIANFTAVDREKKTVKATIHIFNATNVTATIYISGDAAKFQHSLDFVGFYHDHASKNSPSKSIAMIFVRNSTQSVTRKPHFRNSIGLRQSGDELLYFESRNVTNSTRFPSRSFEYIGDDKTKITYVGFSFNSPTAIAFVNTTFVLKNEFSTIAYDMNVEHFVANVSIYGLKNIGRSSELTSVYKEIIEPKEICCWCSYYKKYPTSCGERPFD